MEDSVCRVITIPVVKINKMADNGAPRLRVNEVVFVIFCKYASYKLLQKCMARVF